MVVFIESKSSSVLGGELLLTGCGFGGASGGGGGSDDADETNGKTGVGAGGALGLLEGTVSWGWMKLGEADVGGAWGWLTGGRD